MKKQKYNPKLGVQGNIERLLNENERRQNDIRNEYQNRIDSDNYNRTEVEQAHTDSYLDLVQAQQNITDLQIQIWELGGN